MSRKGVGRSSLETFAMIFICGFGVASARAEEPSAAGELSAACVQNEQELVNRAPASPRMSFYDILMESGSAIDQVNLFSQHLNEAITHHDNVARKALEPSMARSFYAGKYGDISTYQPSFRRIVADFPREGSKQFAVAALVIWEMMKQLEGTDAATRTRAYQNYLKSDFLGPPPGPLPASFNGGGGGGR
jgi:hypothetical protein